MDSIGEWFACAHRVYTNCYELLNVCKLDLRMCRWLIGSVGEGDCRVWNYVPLLLYYYTTVSTVTTPTNLPHKCVANTNFKLATSYKPTSYKLQTTSYKLQATSYKLQTTNYNVDLVIWTDRSCWPCDLPVTLSVLSFRLKTTVLRRKAHVYRNTPLPGTVQYI